MFGAMACLNSWVFWWLVLGLYDAVLEVLFDGGGFDV